jgi:plastocyanin
MRRHLALIVTLLVLGVSALAVGVIEAGAATGRPATVTRKVVRIFPMSLCKNGAEFCFQPAKISIASGTKVIFKNKTTTIHTVTRCLMPACPVSGGTGTDTGFGSPGYIQPGTSYSFTFHGIGTYVYYCQVHGYAIMHGTITVT